MNILSHLTFKVVVVVFLILFLAHAEAQTQTWQYTPFFGPPNVALGGVLYSYLNSVTNTYTDDSGNVQSSSIDYYGAGYYMQDPSTLRDVSGNPVAFIAIGSDGITYLNSPPGVILFQEAGPGDFWDGSAWVSKSYPGAGYFQIGTSPWYWFNGSSDRVIDASSGIWPPSDVTFSSSLPQQVFVNGKIFNFQSTSQAGGSYYVETSYYQGPTDNEFVQIQREANNGGQAIGGSTISGNVNGVGGWQALIDPNSLQISSLSSNNIAIAFSMSSVDNPVNGPYFVSWNANFLQFYYTTQDNRDVYWAPGDADGDFTVVVGSDDSVLALHGTESLTGSYVPTNKTFDVLGAPDANDVIALDQDGNPYANELPAGLTLLFGSNDPGQQILAGSGTAYTPPTFSYQRSDLSFGLKYINLPNGVYLVKDENGHYTAPPYAYVSGSEVVENAISGWPATNIYPQQLYINGIPCQMVSGSQYDSGAGFPRNGGVSYRASAYDLTVVLSWNWTDASTGFQGFVTGKYGQSSSFKGSWDGLGNFSNMTDGVIASVTAPTNAPTDGNPPQVSVNGTGLQYNSLASTALANAGTPGDVYSGSLGQTLTIYQNGTVSYVPALNATAITGTYNATTHQFSFGTSGNTVTISNPDGSTSSAAITATDFSGHNLANSAGTTSSGGTTELAGGLDVQGNNFTLGSWTDASQASIPGFLLSFTPPSGSNQALLRLGSPIAVSNWLWSHATSDGSTDHQPVMQLDSSNRLSLFAPANGNTPATATIVFDPAGVSLINGLIQIAPQGDILMGEFGN